MHRLIIAICLIVTNLSAIQPADADDSVLCREISSHLSSARRYFSKTAIRAAKEISTATKPKQADLYILVHYLIDHRVLNFGPGGKEEDQLTQSIVGYFLSTFDKGAWRKEGCLLIKLLIGLRDNGVSYEKIEPLERFYAQLIEENWQSQNVGECFSTEIERTYMLDVASSCTNASNELEAKVGYYVATTSPDVPNLLRKVKLPFLTDHAARPLSSWWGIIPDVWIALTAAKQKVPLVTADRLESTRLNFEDSVKAELKRTPPRFRDADQLLFGDLVVSGKVSADDRLMLKALLSQQLEDGSFPAKVKQTPAGHDTRATPTHFAIQALTEAERLLCSPSSKSSM
jgi:hypothetical protein